MSEKLYFKTEFSNHPDNSKMKCNEDINSIPTKSPRYMRKKRVTISQARRLHSQHTMQTKSSCAVSNLPAEKCIGTMCCSSSKNDQFHTEESQFPLSIDNLERLKQQLLKEKCRNLIQINKVHKLERSFSYPCFHHIPLNNLVASKSCDIIPNLSMNILDNIWATSKLISNVSDSVPVDLAYKEKNSIDSISIHSSTTENIVSSCTNSRRSSTSTVRERRASVDSAFSQISITDVEEIEGILHKENETRINVNSTSTWKPHHSRSHSNTLCESIQFESPEDSEFFSCPSSFSENKDSSRKSIFEGRQMAVPTECFFPRPQQGQSLTSFLSSNEFNISAELDRENAHFCISEALIAAIEHMKCSRTMRIIEEEEDSDEEIRKLTQRIRIRRGERQREKIMKNFVLLSDGKTDTTTSQSASPPASSHSSDFEIDSIGSDDEVEDLELSANTESNLSSIRENGLSLSLASLYSDADIHKVPFHPKDCEIKKFQDSDSTNLSAESVALSLLRRFSEKHLPKASELQWLVSEQDAPQRLLPLPDSWPVSPDTVEEEYCLEKTRLRGNLEWAPPRPQIIFIIHSNIKRKDIIERQKYRCAGCGMKIEKNYINRFRYCDYFGKYFCQCCHCNSLAHIPGRILWKWDFTKYYVSKFAWNLLDQMYFDPLFSIVDINSNLYQKVRQLELCRAYRMQLFYLKDFMRTCRKAEIIQVTLEKQSHHIIYEPHMYSLSDLVKVKNGELSKHLSQLVSYCIDHVKQCVLCQAKGFICEICGRDNEIIFPFQLDKVILCQSCGSCFHKRCYKNVKCPRCIRIEERRKRFAEHKSDDEP